MCLYLCGNNATSILFTKKRDMEEPTVVGLSRESWGPRFWKVLHTLAECSGGIENPILSNDEADAWILLLKVQMYVMPCQLCKKHYQEWLQTHKFDHLRTIDAKNRRRWLRIWLWGCHSSVNERNGKQNPSIDDISTIYPKQSIEKEVKDLFSMFQLGLIKRKLKLEEVARWKLLIGRLRSMYGI
jgi:hypothetical protein